MTPSARRVVGFIGALVLGIVIGGAFDKAGITPNSDADMLLRGIVAGIALGGIVIALIRD